MDNLSSVQSIYRRVATRIVPFLFVCYLIALIDRLNVGFAKLQFMSDLHLTEAQFGLAASLFYVGYILFEVPSNLITQRRGIRITLLRIMILWGAVTMLLAIASTQFQFYVLRFLVGAAEAGFLPGVLLYLTFWFPERYRGRITTLFVAALPISGMIGGPLAGWIMTATDGWLGLRGWQYLFMIEGVPAVVFGVLAYRFLSNYPSEAAWLSDREREIIERDLRSERSPSQGGPSSFRDALRDRRVYGFALTYFVFFCLENALLVWIPTLLRSVSNASILEIGWISGGISIVATMGMLGISINSDRHQERRWHVIGCGLVAGATFLLLPLVSTTLIGTTIVLMVAAVSVFAFLGLFWTIPSSYLRGTSAAGGLALISSVGALGGVVSPVYVGWMKDFTGSYYGSLGSLGVLLIAGMGLLYLCLPTNGRGALQPQAKYVP